MLTRDQNLSPLSPHAQLIFSEDCEDPSALDSYEQGQPDQGHKAAKWVIRDGALYGEGIHNAALWISPLTLPESVRIEFKATALSKEGDLKCELYGDGKNHQSGYILIAGGWKNRMNIIAYGDEHGEDECDDDDDEADDGDDHDGDEADDHRDGDDHDDGGDDHGDAAGERREVRGAEVAGHEPVVGAVQVHLDDAVV